MDNERNNETQELMQPPRSLRILHYVDVVVGIGLIILGYFYISNAGLMYYRCQNGITEDYMQEYVKFYQAELKSIETYLYLGDTENYPQYCYKPKANKYLQRNFELSKISGETEKEIDMLHKKLLEGGSELMPLAKYDWSTKYVWLQDKYGVNWQLSFGGMEKINKKISIKNF